MTLILLLLSTVHRILVPDLQLCHIIDFELTICRLHLLKHIFVQVLQCLGIFSMHSAVNANTKSGWRVGTTPSAMYLDSRTNF